MRDALFLAAATRFTGAATKKVPCQECEQCGETEISDDVMKQLESMVDIAKKMMQEIAVIDYAGCSPFAPLWADHFIFGNYNCYYCPSPL